jgi:hypothetical protein
MPAKSCRAFEAVSRVLSKPSPEPQLVDVRVRLQRTHARACRGLLGLPRVPPCARRRPRWSVLARDASWPLCCCCFSARAVARAKSPLSATCHRGRDQAPGRWCRSPGSNVSVASCSGITRWRILLGAVTGHPAVSALPRDPQLLGHVRDWTMLATDPFDQQHTTMQIQPSITVGREDLRTVETRHPHRTRRSSPRQQPDRSVTNVLAEYK